MQRRALLIGIVLALAAPAKAADDFADLWRNRIEPTPPIPVSRPKEAEPVKPKRKRRRYWRRRRTRE